MANFRIVSENLTIGKKGDTLSEDALDGLNIEALIAGGHLEAVTNKHKNNDNTEEK